MNTHEPTNKLKKLDITLNISVLHVPTACLFSGRNTIPVF